MTTKLTLHLKGRDNWDRPVYESNGTLYVDVDPRKDSSPNIHAKCANEFYGEPNSPIPNNCIVEFVPYRDIW